MSQNKKMIAVTGQIGSGKSTLCGILRDAGETCFSCDAINKELLTQKNYLEGLKHLFPDVFDGDFFCKEKLRNLIYENENERQKLNKYSHSRIKYELLRMIDECDKQRVFVEVPLLNQTDFTVLFDEIWVVVANEKMRTRRLMIRDHSTMEFIQRQIASQHETTEYSVRVEIIQNNGDMEELRNKVNELLKKI